MFSDECYMVLAINGLKQRSKARVPSYDIRLWCYSNAIKQSFQIPSWKNRAICLSWVQRRGTIVGLFPIRWKSHYKMETHCGSYSALSVARVSRSARGRTQAGKQYERHAWWARTPPTLHKDNVRQRPIQLYRTLGSFSRNLGGWLKILVPKPRASLSFYCQTQNAEIPSGQWKCNTQCSLDKPLCLEHLHF
jgi:hypothetical protein